MDKGVFAKTEQGTPQGGVISPLLANIALTGMENAIGVKYRKDGKTMVIKSRRALVRYADDFVIFTKTRKDARAARRDIANWLQSRGLELSMEKTRIRKLQDGFDFLGFNIRLYKVRDSEQEKLLIMPSKEAIQRFKDRLKMEWHGLKGHSIFAVLKILRGWGNYYNCKYATFIKLDHNNHLRSLKWGMWLTGLKGNTSDA